MRFFIIQNGLANRETHYFGESLWWREACARRGIETRFYIQQNADPEVVATLQARPVFPFPADARLNADPDMGILHDFIVMGEAFGEACAALTDDGITSEDVVLVPFASEKELYGLARWLRQLPASRQPRLLINFQNPDLGWPVDAAGIHPDGRFPRYALLRLLEVVAPDRFFITSTNHRLQKLLRRIMKHPCQILPMLFDFLSGWWVNLIESNID
jgi:hypothetical protein